MVKLLLTVRKVREYTELDPVLWTELLISTGELQSLLPYLIVVSFIIRVVSKISIR